MADVASFDDDPTLYLFTSLTAGSSHIITATSRLETILKANKIPFQALDTATEERARKLWGRRAGKRKLPGLVKQGIVLGDLEQVEEWNEFGELKENIGPTPSLDAAPSGPSSADLAAKPAQTSNTLGPSPSSKTTLANPQPGAAVRQLGTEAAAAANAKKAGVSVLPKAGVHASKIRPLPSDVAAAPKEVTAHPDLQSGAERERAKDSKENEPPTKETAQLALGTDAAPLPEKMTSSAMAKSVSIAQAAEESPAMEAAGLSAVGDTKTDAIAEADQNASSGPLADSMLQPPTSGQELAARSQDNLAAVGLSAEGDGEVQRPTEHQGSSVNLADEAVVKEVEKATAIPEEREKEANGYGEAVKGAGGEDKQDEIIGASEGAKDMVKEKVADVKEREGKAEDGKADTKTQQQRPADAEKAGESVQD
ncbi:MAG: hypothetical protein M1822_000035 [Bathelium mastoideum]|nr:MAG: hypothetical protein M1822_000035 [Bathelium mastoideum]